jgi:hypothetical protein
MLSSLHSQSDRLMLTTSEKESLAAGFLFVAHNDGVHDVKGEPALFPLSSSAFSSGVFSTLTDSSLLLVVSCSGCKS